jgi:hypothetical protein
MERRPFKILSLRPLCSAGDEISKNGLATTDKASTRDKDIGNGVLMERTQKEV